MKKYFSIFRKSAKVRTVGVTESDYYKIYNSIIGEYEEAKARQKKSDAPPSGYMKGLMFALNAMDSIKPYNVTSEEVH